MLLNFKELIFTFNLFFLKQILVYKFQDELQFWM